MSRGLEDYITVNERIQKFYEDCPDGALTSEILSDDGKLIQMKATVQVPSGEHGYLRIVATGHAEEIRGQGNVNRTSALENCETSAWGRALAAAGLEIKKGIASREEMEKVQRDVPMEKAPPKTLTAKQLEGLMGRLIEADVPEEKVQLALTSFGVEQLTELTAQQGRELLKKVSA